MRISLRRYQRGNQNQRKTNNIMVKRKKNKRTSNDIQNITHKTKDLVTRTPLKHGVNSGAPEGKVVPAPLVALVVLL